MPDEMMAAAPAPAEHQDLGGFPRIHDAIAAVDLANLVLAGRAEGSGMEHARDLARLVLGDDVPAPPPTPSGLVPFERVQHVNSGGIYEVLARNAEVQTGAALQDYDVVAVYRNAESGDWWVRPISEMDDGRFVPAPPSPSSGEG